MPYFAAIRQDEYPATDELQCIAVHIPAGDEYKALLAGFIAFLSNVSSYEDPESAQADGIAAVFDEGYAQTNWDGCGVPPECEHVDSEITIFPGNMTVVAGNPIVNQVNTSARNNYLSQQSPNINGNSRRTYRQMAAGVWEWRLTASTVANGCSLTFQVIASDGTILTPGILNLRTAGTVFNTVFSGTFTLPSDGNTQIYFGVGAGSTGGFVDFLQYLEMWRTS